MTSAYRERRKKRYTLWILTGLLVFLTFIASALFGDAGILVNMRVRAEHERLAREKQRLAAENNRLRHEILALQRNGRKIEEISRREFGMGRPGEYIYYFPEDGDEAVQVHREPDRRE